MKSQVLQKKKKKIFGRMKWVFRLACFICNIVCCEKGLWGCQKSGLEVIFKKCDFCTLAFG
jgi:hypothetical protein